MTAVLIRSANPAVNSLDQRSSRIPTVSANNDNRYHALSSRQMQRVAGPVVIVTSAPLDAEYVSRLLESSGLERTKIVISNANDADTTGAYALMIVHRRDEDINLAVGAELNHEQHPAIRKIVLTDCQREETIVQFLEKGARHCIDLNDPEAILQARLEAALRVHPGTAQQSFSVGDIHFDIQKRRVSRAGEAIELSPKEFEFARYLFSNPDKIVGNAELMTSVWSLPISMDSRRIDTAACRVRKKLRLAGDDGWRLKRIRRVGYHLQTV